MFSETMFSVTMVRLEEHLQSTPGDSFQAVLLGRRHVQQLLGGNSRGVFGVCGIVQPQAIEIIRRAHVVRQLASQVQGRDGHGCVRHLNCFLKASWIAPSYKIR